jgi:hypothetical protein
MRARLHAIEQDGNVCAVAALRTILDLQYRVDIPEPVLEALGTYAHQPIREYGTDVHQFRHMLREANRAFNTGPTWRFRVTRRGTWRFLHREVRAGRRPIARVRLPLDEFRADPGSTDYHSVVVYDVDSAGDELKVFDPATGKLHRMRWEEFEEWWTDPDGFRWAGVVTP